MYEACGSMCRLAECVCWSSYVCVCIIHYGHIMTVILLGSILWVCTFYLFFFAMLTCTVCVGQEVCPCRIVINI